MKSHVIKIPPRKKLIAPSSWTKKLLADAHFEAMLFCASACLYCSSNAGLQLRFLNKSLKRIIQTAVEQLTDKPFNPHDAADITIAYREVVKALDNELSRMKRKPGAGKTLVFSQLTDGFSPVLLKNGIVRQILELLLEKTEYRIRILTKNAIVGRHKWVKLFAQHPGRFVVGLSCGSLDADFTRRMERLTSSPHARIAALHNLQGAGVLLQSKAGDDGFSKNSAFAAVQKKIIS